MAREFQVQIDRSIRADQFFPQWEKLDKVSKVATNVGRDYEGDEAQAGTANVQLEFNPEDTIYATDDNVDLVDDSYGNGLSYVAMDYYDIIDGKVTYTNCLLGQPHEKGSVYPIAPTNGANTSYDWRFAYDSMYAALVKAGETYCVGFLGEELNWNGSAPAVTEHAKAYWWTDSGVLIKVEEFFTATLPTTGQTQIKGKITAPSTARYLSVGGTPTGVSGATRNFKYSKFQVHKYDAAYEASHSGNYLKSFVIDNVRTAAPQAGSKIRYVSPGNQFDINRWYPKKMLGANVVQRGSKAYNLLPIAYDIDTISTVSDFFTATNASFSLLTSGVITGTKSLNIVTTATSPATITIGALSTTYPVAVQPGVSYTFGFNAYSAIATACSVQVNVNYAGGTINAGTNVIPGTSTVSFAGWGFTAPAGVYAVQIQLVITGGVRNIVVDDFQVLTDAAEQDPYANKLGFLGGFESITGADYAKYLSSSTSSAFSVVLDRNNAHSGNRCLKLTKASGSTTANIRFGATSNVFPIYAEARGPGLGVSYTFAFWAKASAANANTKIQAIYKDNLSQSTVSTTTLQALTTSWKQYGITIPVARFATAVHVGIQVVADSTPGIDIYIDDVDIHRFTPMFRADLSSVTANSRISVYDIDTATSGQAILHYGNDSLDDGGWSYRTYHSGTTRTRFKGTLKSIGYDAPVGTVAAIAFNTTSGRMIGRPGTKYNGYLGGNSSDEINVPLTLPTGGGSVSFDVLGPDIPFCSAVPIIFMTVPNGVWTIGYEFIGEYIGPDGYQDHPEYKEASIFTGVVDVRDDTVGSMSTDGVNRSATNVNLSCTDKFGQLGSIKLNSPYKQTVQNDNPVVYLPLDDDLDAIGNLSNRVDVDFSVKTQGVPSNWGVSTADVILAEEGGSLRFENPPLTGLGATQGQVIYGRYDGTLINKQEASYEIWYQRDTTAPDMIGNALFNHNFAQAADPKIYVRMQNDTLLYKWGQLPGVIGLTYNIGTARADGEPHHVAMTKDKNGLVSCYFDGSMIGTFTAIDRDVDQLVIGGSLPQTYQFYAGNLAHFAWYDKALPADVIKTHYQAGYYNRQTTNEVERIKYVLQSSKQPGLLPLLRTRNGDIATGLSVLNPASWSTSVSPGDLIRSAAKDSGGIVFAGGDGSFTFENRQSRLSLGSAQANKKWSIGAGDVTIQPEGDYGGSPDITKLINEIAVTGKFAGASKDTAFIVQDKLSQQLKMKSGKEFRSDLYFADEAKQSAYWDIATHNKPLTRYKTLVFININDVTDDFCRRVQPGDYLSGNIANANGLGKGNLSHFVERVKHTMTPLTDGTAYWLTELEISPAYNQRAWIIEDPVYGNLDGQNRLAY